ncbi:M56 family metallopeptidase [Winogradskyella aquimaris]|uniref:M56 family metallopeptidase n=1 Tax=Winogradskyella aquimaris TaxID=864074 RepID=A0ABU5EI69_9FLAO|nr:M56 family metallopeptidase [Winogradskyella aquimaris]MDY2585808.1 M56 family metallopeptidase [Winogradskyella aquimaris]
MELYLLKFSACLLVFWLVYVLLLEKQQMHRFKRFYLIGSFAVALVIPQITIIEYVEPIVQNFEVTSNYAAQEAELTAEPIEGTSVISLEAILWTIYILGAILFFIRFIGNLNRLYKQISKNDKQRNQNFIYVLLKTYRIPHSFFKYIFLNKSLFENNNIPKEVLLHEETHAKQWHSLDILFLELLQIIFWFHPLVYILKHHVKLNHEFLADDAVLQQGFVAKSYQNILLQFSSNTHNQQLASAINYSSIKKRFTVMKTQTSKTRIWLSTLLVLPILAILFYSFAEREYVQKNKTENLLRETNSFLVVVEKKGDILELRCENGCKWSQLVLEPKSEPYIINDYGFSEGKTLDTDDFAFSIKPNRNGVELNGLKGTAWIDLAFSLPENKKQAVNQLGMTKSTAIINAVKNEKVITIKATNDLLYIDNHKSSLDTYVKDLNKITKSWTSKDFEQTKIDLKSENCSQSFLNNLNELHKKTDHFLITVIGSKSIIKNEQNLPTKKEIYDYNVWAKKIQTESKKVSYDASWYPPIDEQDLIKFSDIYKRMSSHQKNKAVEFPFPRLDVKPNEQQQATKQQIAEYNTWAKKMNTAIKKAKETKNKSYYPVIKKKEYNKYYNIYKNLMSEAQRKKAEAWPNLPPPPPPPPSVPEPPKAKKNIEDTPPPPPEPKETHSAYIIVNGRQVKGSEIILTIDELKDLKLSLNESAVNEFEIIFPDNKPMVIQGNKLNEKALTKIQYLENEQVVSVYDIKNTKNIVVPPLLIVIKN